MIDTTVAVVEELPPGASRARLSWGAIFGGTFTALGVWILLGAFGLAAGLTAVSPADPDLGGVAIWLGVWGLVVPILALFCGAWLAARAAGARRTVPGVMHAVVVWGVTTFLAAALVWNLSTAVIGRTVGAAAQVASGIGRAAVSAVQGIDPAQAPQVGNAVMSYLGIERSEIMNTLNQRLVQQGKEPITAAQFQAAMQDIANSALRQGTLSDEMIVGAFAQHTALTRADVRDVGQQLQQQWNQTVGPVITQLQQFGGTAANTALAAVDQVGKAFWWMFGSLLVGLGAACAGGVLGTRSRRRDEPAPIGRVAPAPGMRSPEPVAG